MAGPREWIGAGFTLRAGFHIVLKVGVHPGAAIDSFRCDLLCLLVSLSDRGANDAAYHRIRYLPGGMVFLHRTSRSCARFDCLIILDWKSRAMYVQSEYHS